MCHTGIGKVFSVSLFIVSCFLFFVPVSFAQEGAVKTGSSVVKEGVSLEDIPHDQISDEGKILWEKCLICHVETPNIKEAKSIMDAKLRFDEDIKQGCYRCHPERKHPGGEWYGAMKSKGQQGAPDHEVVPSKSIAKNIELSLKESDIIFPVEPKTGKIFCATCHNPHERGLLIGKADKGGDYEWRLRSAGKPICQYCHRK